MEIFYTIISGVAVFIASQYILEFILKSWINFKKTIAEIDNSLKFYSNIIVNPPFSNLSNQLPQDYLLARNEMRRLSCKLETNYKLLPLKFIFKFKKQDISEAARDLIWLSNAIGQRDETGTINVPLMASDKIDNIRKKLGIPQL